MRRYTLELSTDSIKKLQKELLDYKDELHRKVDLFCMRLAEEGVIVAKTTIAEYDAVYTGELLGSIRSEPGTLWTDGSVWYVTTSCPWAKYVEFGTGIVGSQSSHPMSGIVGWKYDVNNHGEKGWFYFKDGEWHWTKGMPSRPFMYETALHLAMIASKVAKEVFG